VRTRTYDEIKDLHPRDLTDMERFLMRISDPGGNVTILRRKGKWTKEGRAWLSSFIRR
jgi:hypothetical protein